MADSLPLKRQRDEQVDTTTTTTTLSGDVVLVHEENKRHKSYNHILSLLDADNEDEPNQDLSSLITTLQRELSSDSSDFDHPFPSNTSTLSDQGNRTTCTDSSPASSTCSNEEDDKERVIRHLLEASDDELGIPNRDDDVFGEQGLVFNSEGNGFAAPFCDGLWELEDEAANYYTLLQSELFM